MKLVLVVLLVVGCGSSKPKPFVVLDDPGPTQIPANVPPATAPTEEPPVEEPPADAPMPPEPTDKASNDDLEKSMPAKAGQAAIAAKLNTEAIALVKKSKFAEATGKFRDAVAREPQARYFFNLCFSLYQEGKFSEALVSCNAVGKTEPTTELEAKAEKLTARVRWEAKRQGIDVKP